MISSWNFEFREEKWEKMKWFQHRHQQQNAIPCPGFRSICCYHVVRFKFYWMFPSFRFIFCIFFGELLILIYLHLSFVLKPFRYFYCLSLLLFLLFIHLSTVHRTLIHLWGFVLNALNLISLKCMVHSRIWPAMFRMLSELRAHNSCECKVIS